MQAPTQIEKEDAVRKFLDDQAADHFLEDVAVHRTPRCETFLQYYDGILGLIPHGYNVRIAPAAYPDHAAVRSMLDQLQTDPSITKRNFKLKFSPVVLDAEKDHATRALVRLAFMIDCAPRDGFAEGHKVGDFVPRSWGEDQTWADFAEHCFPPINQTPKNPKDYQTAMAERSRMKAWKLKTRYKVKLRPTDNLAEHLIFDKDMRTLKVFRHVNFLKAHLRRSEAKKTDLRFPDSLKLGTLPPQLLLEVLDSTQFLLFPNDDKSEELLDKFIEKYHFDQCSKYREGHIRKLDEHLEYKYLENRLLVLLNVVDNPPPTNRIVAWFERHTSERNALTVAILGLFLTALFGFFTLIFGVVATVYSIKQFNVAVLALQSPMPTTTSSTMRIFE